MMAKSPRARLLLLVVTLAVAPVVLVGLGAAPVGAATITVDNTGDPAVGNPANCPAVPVGTCTLRDAIAAANANAGADTVDVTVGPIALANGALSHPSTGALTVSGNGFTVDQTTANDVLFSNGPVTATDLTTTGGTNAIDAAGPVTVSGTSITTTNGHGIVAFGVGNSATIDHSTISAAQGAVFASRDVTVTSSSLTSSAGVGAIAGSGNLSISASSVAGTGAGGIAGKNATVSDSDVSSTGGVGVLAGGGGTATVTASTVDGQAGGIQAGLDVTVTSSRITSGVGIGVLSNFASVTATDSSITGADLAIVANSAVTTLRAEITGGPSGAVLAINGAAHVTSSTVTGGGHFGVQAPSEVVIVNSTITGNGGCGANSPRGTVTLVYATVVENGAVNCGSNVNAATLVSFASVIALHAPNCTVGTTVSHGYNYSDDNTCGFDQSTDVNTGANPLLGPLADNGGTTRTRLPQIGSPLIDGVALGACSADGAASIAPLVDQRGLGRPSGAGCDIGAVEVQVAPEVPAVPGAVLVTPRFTG